MTPQQEARELCERALPYLLVPEAIEYVTNYLMGAEQLPVRQYIGKHYKVWTSFNLSTDVMHVLYTSEDTDSITGMGSFRTALNRAYVSLSAYKPIQNHGIQESPTH